MQRWWNELDEYHVTVVYVLQKSCFSTSVPRVSPMWKGDCLLTHSCVSCHRKNRIFAIWHSWHAPDNKQRRAELDTRSPVMSICWREKRRQLTCHKVGKKHWKLLNVALHIISTRDGHNNNCDLKLEYEEWYIWTRSCWKGSNWEETSQKNLQSTASGLLDRRQSSTRSEEQKHKVQNQKENGMGREERACLVCVKGVFYRLQTRTRGPFPTVS